MTEVMLDRLEPWHLWTRATAEFERRDYYGAAETLERLLEVHPYDAELGEARELLARSYFHSARLERAVEAARDLLEREPQHGYAALLLTRSLERLCRDDEAVRARRRAEALGAL